MAYRGPARVEDGHRWSRLADQFRDVKWGLGYIQSVRTLQRMVVLAGEAGTERTGRDRSRKSITQRIFSCVDRYLSW
jgi:hypothetical protein